MPDTIAPSHDMVREIPLQIATERADGFLVIARKLKTGSVVPPYRYHFTYEHHDSLRDASESFAEFEADGNWTPVAIMACRAGVPFGRLSAFSLARLVQERRVA